MRIVNLAGPYWRQESVLIPGRTHSPSSYTHVGRFEASSDRRQPMRVLALGQPLSRRKSRKSSAYTRPCSTKPAHHRACSHHSISSSSMHIQLRCPSPAPGPTQQRILPTRPSPRTSNLSQTKRTTRYNSLPLRHLRGRSLPGCLPHPVRSSLVRISSVAFFTTLAHGASLAHAAMRAWCDMRVFL